MNRDHSNNMEGGFALPLTLIVLAMLITLALGLMHTSVQRVNNAYLLKERWHNALQIQNMLNVIAWNLLAGTKEHNKVIHAGVTIPIDGHAFEIQGMQIKVQDESGLIPLEFFQQKAVDNVMKNVMKNTRGKVTDMNPAAILGDWVDVDQIPRISGLEKQSYKMKNYKYMPRNHPLRTLDELLEVPLIDYDLFNGVRGKPGLRDIFVLGASGQVNYATAPDEALAALLPSNSGLLKLVVQARNQGNWPELMHLIYLANGESDNPLTPGAKFRIKIRSVDKLMSGRFEIILQSQADGRAFSVNLWQLPDFPRG